jgi:hypothetical protein
LGDLRNDVRYAPTLIPVVIEMSHVKVDVRMDKQMSKPTSTETPKPRRVGIGVSLQALTSRRRTLAGLHTKIKSRKRSGKEEKDE